MRFLLFTFFGTLIMLTSFGAGSGDGKIFPFEYSEFTLDNGLKVFVIPTPNPGLISYYSVVRTGSRDEYEEGHSGFAHFFEHMMFRGTKKYPGSVYDNITVAMGADANAYTTDDYTCYHLSFTKDNLEKIAEIESDRFQNLSYEEDAFKTESGAVYGEYRKGKTSPSFWMEEKLFETAFDKHTYKHTTIGFEKDIAAMPTMYQYSIDFLKRYYRPENIVLCIVGDVQKDKVMDLVKKYYGNWQKGYVTPQIQNEPVQTAPRVASVKYPGKTLPMIAVAFKSGAFNPTDKNYFATSLIGDLAFGETSDIYKKLFIKEQKVQMIAPEFSENRDPNLNSVYAIVKDAKDVEYVKNEILNELTKLQNTPVSQQKLDNLKKHMKYGYLMSQDTPDKVAGGLARILALTTDVETINKMFNTIQTISPADVMNAAKTMFVPEHRTIVTLTGGK